MLFRSGPNEQGHGGRKHVSGMERSPMCVFLLADILTSLHSVMLLPPFLPSLVSFIMDSSEEGSTKDRKEGIQDGGVTSFWFLLSRVVVAGVPVTACAPCGLAPLAVTRKQEEAQQGMSV